MLENMEYTPGDADIWNKRDILSNNAYMIQSTNQGFLLQ